MKKPTIRRVLAYLVDMIIIGIIASSLASVKAFNPYYKEYQAAESKLETIMEENQGRINELINDEEVIDLSYEITKTGVFVNIYTVGLSLLYFVGFQYITKGKTLGKKLMKIEVISNDKNDVTLLQLLKRSIVINTLVTGTINIILIMAFSKTNYINYSRYIQLLETTLILVSIAFVLYREDGRGLHDLFGGTRVISSEDREFYLKHEEVKEAEVVKEKTTKSSNTEPKKIAKKTTTKKKEK